VVDRLTDSRLYGHLWSTEELHEVFGEEQRLQTWLDILGALAAGQAELGIIPEEAAREIAEVARVERLDLDYVAEETRATGHSTLGLIRGLQRILSPAAGEYVYYGATVQDLTDTWTAMAMARVGAIVWRDLGDIERRLIDLAREHRATVMPGRTHGQPGAPMTFGLKVASWADEVQRHRERVRQGAPRWLVGQLAGACGTLAFFGLDGPALRGRVCARLGLNDPGVGWTSARDRIAEFGSVLAMVAATLARMGNEVYELQRPEIGELREGVRATTVGSITMPHKRNPENSEHIVTLARLVRANAGVLLEGMVTEHERDGRAWKAEWPAFTEVCLLTCTALKLACELLRDLKVDSEAMARNVAASADSLASERLLAELAPTLGKHRAQAALQEAIVRARESGAPLADAFREVARTRLTSEAISLLVANPDTGTSSLMVDEVVVRCSRALESEPSEWP
jgi:adenylosuccinate lyase